MSFNQTVVPQCGATCLEFSLPQSSCAPNDLACLCLDTVFNSAVAICVAGSCTVKEQLIFQRISLNNCNVPIVDRGYIVTILQIVVTIIQDVFFSARIMSRVLKLAPWGADDTTIVFAWILQKVFLAGGILSNENGLGIDIWYVPFEQITTFLQIFFVFEVLYTLTLGIIKISICFLFLRLFPEPKIRRYLWATQVFNVLLVITYVIANTVQCKPISYFWNMWDGEHVGKCVNIYAMAWSQAIINIALDFWMLALPASQVWGLNMPLRRKLGVMVMFGLGIFMTIVSIIRLSSLIGFAQAYPQNPTMNFFGISIWSALELTTGVTIACLPATRQMFIKYMPAVPEIVSRYTSRLGGSLGYSSGSKPAGSELDSKPKEMSHDRSIRRVPTDDIPMYALPPLTPHDEAWPRRCSVASSSSSFSDGCCSSSFYEEHPAAQPEKTNGGGGRDLERAAPVAGPGAHVEAPATRQWRPSPRPQPKAD